MRSASRALIHLGPPRARATSIACRTSASICPASFDAEPSTASPTATPAARSSPAGAMPDPRRRLDVGHHATAVPVRATRWMSSLLRCTQWASQTSGPSHSRVSNSCSGRHPKIRWQYSSSSTVSAMCVCSRTPARLASAADSRISRGVTENGEHGATATRTMAPGRGSCHRRIASSVCVRMASVSSTIESGGSPPLLAPRSIEPRHGWKRIPICLATSTSASKIPPTPLGKT